ncbi:MAG: hypothetical protein J0L84_03890 [Verrucomicrobia bacterium]|nr:hypothetical protein [Verrucomicrobiota bacterium]
MPLTLLWALLALLTLAGAGGCSRAPQAPETSEADPVDLGPTTAAQVAKAKAEMKERLAEAPPAPPPSAPAISEPVAGKPRAPKDGEQVCFVCEAKGEVPCSAPRCNAGYRPCPGPCFKRHEGTWAPYPGQPGVMARAVRTPDRKTYYISEGHAGEVWVFEGGALVSKGLCPTCKGHRAVACKSCKSSGKQECPVCRGEGAIPAAWTPEDNPWFNRQPDLVRLKDGRVFLGAESGGDELLVMWKTRAGEIITVPRTEVAQWPKNP